ncbi:MAG TPA: prolyl oligopeptidase family serine peptidase [Cellvibrionaceae bacterium]
MRNLFKKMSISGCSLLCACSLITPPKAQLLLESYTSNIDQSTKQFYVYLPKGYTSKRRWPVLLFLHGDGERGNGREELGYVLKHGPLYEAWIRGKDLPFIIISPQLPMFGRDQLPEMAYIRDRKLTDIPLPQTQPQPPQTYMQPAFAMSRAPELSNWQGVDPLLPDGWERAEKDLLSILTQVQTRYSTDSGRIYLTGLSYGGFGTWYMASRHPHLFAAIAPVVGWGHASLMQPIANAHLPVWAFAAGRDEAVPISHFYAGMRALEAFGTSEVRFTVHEDMAHDAWKRIYAGDDFYSWLLAHEKLQSREKN